MTAPQPGTFGARTLRFCIRLRAPRVPRGVVVMNPYRDARVRECLTAFLGKYFDDARGRTLVFGINPGRFGAGITGITFTDPVVLADVCGIPNHLPRKRELSSVFTYDVIAAMGGAAEFYSRFFLTAVSPLGFTRRGVNLNYYDERALAVATTPFIVRSIRAHLDLGGRRDHAVVLGNGQNARFLEALNARHRFFSAIHALEHPRFILQYRRKRAAEFVRKYVETLTAAAR